MKLSIIADFAIVRAGLRALADHLGESVVFEAPAYLEAVSALQRDRCGAALLDAVMTTVGLCLAICHALCRKPEAPYLVAVEWCGRKPAQLRRLQQAGLQACVALLGDPAPLAQARNAVAQGQVAFLVPS